MDITNRTDLILYWRARVAGPNYQEPWQRLFALGFERILPGQTHRVDITNDAKVLGVWMGVDQSKEMAHDRPRRAMWFKWGAPILILPTPAQSPPFAIIDSWGPRDKYIKGNPIDAEASDRVCAAETAYTALSSIAVAFTAVPGPHNIVGSVIDAIAHFVAMGTQSAPPPLTENQMVRAVSRIVRAELLRDKAMHASRIFARANTFVVEWDGLMASPSRVSDNELQEKFDILKGYLKPESELVMSLDFAAENQTEAMLICSAYMLGIAAYVKMCIYHFIVGQMRGDPLASDRIGVLINRIAPFEIMLKSLIQKTHSEAKAVMGIMYDCDDEIPEVAQLRPAVYRYLIGLESVAPIDTVVARLHGICKCLESDKRKVQSGVIHDLFIFKSNWQHPPVTS